MIFNLTAVLHIINDNLNGKICIKGKVFRQSKAIFNAIERRCVTQNLRESEDVWELDLAELVVSTEQGGQAVLLNGGLLRLNSKQQVCMQALKDHSV